MQDLFHKRNRYKECYVDVGDVDVDVDDLVVLAGLVLLVLVRERETA